MSTFASRTVELVHCLKEEEEEEVEMEKQFTGETSCQMTDTVFSGSFLSFFLPLIN